MNISVNELKSIIDMVLIDKEDEQDQMYELEDHILTKLEKIESMIESEKDEEIPF